MAKKKKTKSRPPSEPPPEPRPSEPRASRSSLVYAAAVLAVGAVVSAALLGAPEDAPVLEQLRVRVIAEHPHATDAFTQGLLWYQGSLYESTGGFSQSSVREVDLETGEVKRRRALDDSIFAEGLARVDDRLFQITWRNHKALVWNISDFNETVAEFDYPGEGWGLCYDGEHLVMSDGSSELTIRSPDTFRVVDVISVTSRGRPVRRLNELECVDGAIYANIWQRDMIVRIDPSTGYVTAEIDASGLLEDHERAGVLNGIAWLPERRHFAITGKLWPALFEVEFVPSSSADRSREN